MRETCAIILAGGAGTRLWPLSRRARPKQMLKLLGDHSLLKHAFDRLTGMFPATAIYVVTNADLISLTHRELPDLPVENIIAEPATRDTANAIGFAAHWISRKTEFRKMFVTTADHLIQPVDLFQVAVEKLLSAVDRKPNALATFGIRPTSPHTGYGYLQIGAAIGDGFISVVAFKEKPDRQTAERYVADGNHLWNSGMFAWRIDTILNELARCLPENARKLAMIAAQLEETADASQIATDYFRLPSISIDFGVMEKAKEVITTELPCEWRDIGSWEVLASMQVPRENGNIVLGAEVIDSNAANNIVVVDDHHLIAVLGVNNLLIVDAGDVTLICSRDQLDQIGDVVEACRAKYGSTFV